MSEFLPDDGRTALERMAAGDPYIGDAELDAVTHRANQMAEEYHRLWLTDRDAARAFLAGFLGFVGDGVTVRAPLYVDYGSHISVGSGTFVNYNCVMLDVAPITIGRNCQIATNVQLLTPTHPLDHAARAAGVESAEPITIGDNVWLGGGVIVLPGVTIGDNTVVGAGSVVTKDLPTGVVAVGNPAHVIKQI